MASATQLLSDEQRAVTPATRPDTGDLPPMPAFQTTAQNGQDKGFPIYEACPLEPPRHSTAHQTVEAFRELNWLASILKQYWHVLAIVIGLIFAAGTAWQKLQTSQAKIEAVAEQVKGHDRTLGEIRESVGIVRGILEGEQRRYITALPKAVPVYPPPAQAAPAPPAPLPAPIPPATHKVKKVQPKPKTLLERAFGR